MNAASRVIVVFSALAINGAHDTRPKRERPPTVEVRRAVSHDRSAPLRSIGSKQSSTRSEIVLGRSAAAPRSASAPPSDIEQRELGTRDPLEPVANFDGLGWGFVGPQGTATASNPSDN